MTTTREQFAQAQHAGATSSLDDTCPYTGLLARAWRDARREMVAERREAMMARARGGM